jgi:hypothetical protein
LDQLQRYRLQQANMFSAVDDDFPAKDSISGRIRCNAQNEENYDIMNVRSPRLLKSSLKPFPPNSSLMPILISIQRKKNG